MKKRNFNPKRTYPPEGNIENETIKLTGYPIIEKNEFIKVKKELNFPIFAVCFDLPFCIHLEDGIYPVNHNNKLNIIKLLKVERENILYLGGQSENIEMPEDPRGIFRYTRCEVIFEDDFTNKIDIENILTNIKKIMERLNFSQIKTFSIDKLPKIRNKKLSQKKKTTISNLSLKNLKQRLIDIIKNIKEEEKYKVYNDLRFMLYNSHARRIINKFIKVYKHVTKKYYLSNIKRTDILYMCISEFKNNGQLNKSFNFSFPNGATLSVPDRSIEEHEKIWEMLNKDEDIDVYKENLHTAHKYLLEENYSMVVVESFSAFELFLEKILLDQLLEQGMTSKKANNYLSKDNNWKVTTRIKDLYREIIGNDLTNLSIYNSWYETKKLRDEIVHSGKREISEIKAKESLNTIESIISIIKEDCN